LRPELTSLYPNELDQIRMDISESFAYMKAELKRQHIVKNFSMVYIMVPSMFLFLTNCYID
jgi:hypothetical protein